VSPELGWRELARVPARDLLWGLEKRTKLIEPGSSQQINLKTKTIRQSVLFKSSPHEVYELLMDSEKHAGFTGEGAEISREVGGMVSAYEGYIEATNEELIPDAKIVQRWRSSEWPDGHYSTVTFELKRTTGGTRLSFTQSGVPEEDYEAKKDGWVESYWEKMKKFLERETGARAKRRTR